MKRRWYEEVPEDRNFLCPEYNRCLERAARNNAMSLGCATCENKELRAQMQFTDMDLIGSIMLLFSIFHPQIRKEIRFDIDTLKSVVKDRLFSGELDSNYSLF